MDLQLFIKEINERFGSPFLPEGFVKAKMAEMPGRETIDLQIGDRTVEFDAEGNSLDSDTAVGEGKKWYIGKPEGEENERTKATV